MMNQQIKQLAREAWLKDGRNKYAKYEISSLGDAILDDLEDFLKMFAESIIQECSQACLDEAEKFRGEQDITDFKICALVVKERFGVE